ncbi:hypothetical protein [Moraxella lacunata]|uniref:hypothetical protein n=1 Tax=Moraxella lacunata TaxID=477 RepID=UPI003EDEC661
MPNAPPKALPVCPTRRSGCDFWHWYCQSHHQAQSNVPYLGHNTALTNPHSYLRLRYPWSLIPTHANTVRCPSLTLSTVFMLTLYYTANFPKNLYHHRHRLAFCLVFVLFYHLMWQGIDMVLGGAIII